jgi:two-component system sensor histidine kinase EvgS
MDMEYLTEVSGGDSDFERELICAFLEAAPSLIHSCEAAIAANDMDAVVYASHTLKGSSRSIGAKQFAFAAEEVERAARVGDIESCRKFAPQIQSAFQTFVDFTTTIAAA